MWIVSPSTRYPFCAWKEVHNHRKCIDSLANSGKLSNLSLFGGRPAGEFNAIVAKPVTNSICQEERVLGQVRCNNTKYNSTGIYLSYARLCLFAKRSGWPLESRLEGHWQTWRNVGDKVDQKVNVLNGFNCIFDSEHIVQLSGSCAGYRFETKHKMRINFLWDFH